MRGSIKAGADAMGPGQGIQKGRGRSFAIGAQNLNHGKGQWPGAAFCQSAIHALKAKLHLEKAKPVQPLPEIFNIAKKVHLLPIV